jgi:hypothetical protein
MLATKRWNPHTLSHSAITLESGFGPEIAPRRKSHRIMNSKQPARYNKMLWRRDLNSTILQHNDIIAEEIGKHQKPVINCSKCQFVNTYETKTCSKCARSLSQGVLHELEKKKRKEDHGEFGRGKGSRNSSGS